MEECSSSRQCAPNYPISRDKMKDFCKRIFCDSIFNQCKNTSLHRSAAVWEIVKIVDENTGLRYSPEHVKSEFRRYFIKGRACRQLPLSICFNIVDAFIDTEASYEFYDDFPSKPPSNEFILYRSERFAETRDSSGVTLSRYERTKLIGKEWHANSDLRLKYREKLEKQRKKYNKRLSKFFNKHPELEECRKKGEKVNVTNDSIFEKTGFRMYKKEKELSKRYADLSTEERESKLERHFNKLSSEMREKYERKSKEWNEENFPKRKMTNSNGTDMLNASTKTDTEDESMPKKKKKRKQSGM